MQPLPIAMQLFQFSLKTSMFCLIPLFIFPCHVLFYISSHASLQCTGKPREFRSKDKRPDLVHIFPFWQFFFIAFRKFRDFEEEEKTVDVLSFLCKLSAWCTSGMGLSEPCISQMWHNMICKIRQI